jgi:hypothetical protein
VIAWNRDQGVTEEISDNLGLLLESLRNSVLEHKFEYIDDCGLVEKI